MTPRISAIDLLKLTEEELLFLYGFIIEFLELDAILIKSIKKHMLLYHLKHYKHEKLDDIRLSIIDKLK